jgi:hypothetical protein
MGLRGPYRRAVVEAGGRNRATPNRSARPSRAYHRLCRVGSDRNGGIRVEPGRRLDHWLALAVRGRPRISPELLTRPEPGTCGFRSIGVWSPVWRSGRLPPLAVALSSTGTAGWCVAVSRGMGSGLVEACIGGADPRDWPWAGSG